ncbi:MAG TPA: hypothetical protein VI959_02305 [Alphaproteobacteria bacterium]|nr:hypothetical protein [Alphaproteobacteria bacterium]
MYFIRILFCFFLFSQLLTQGHEDNTFFKVFEQWEVETEKVLQSKDHYKDAKKLIDLCNERQDLEDKLYKTYYGQKPPITKTPYNIDQQFKVSIFLDSATHENSVTTLTLVDTFYLKEILEEQNSKKKSPYFPSGGSFLALCLLQERMKVFTYNRLIAMVSKTDWIPLDETLKSQLALKEDFLNRTDYAEKFKKISLKSKSGINENNFEEKKQRTLECKKSINACFWAIYKKYLTKFIYPYIKSKVDNGVCTTETDQGVLDYLVSLYPFCLKLIPSESLLSQDINSVDFNDFLNIFYYDLTFCEILNICADNFLKDYPVYYPDIEVYKESDKVSYGLSIFKFKKGVECIKNFWSAKECQPFLYPAKTYATFPVNLPLQGNRENWMTKEKKEILNTQEQERIRAILFEDDKEYKKKPKLNKKVIPPKSPKKAAKKVGSSTSTAPLVLNTPPPAKNDKKKVKKQVLQPQEEPEKIEPVVLKTIEYFQKQYTELGENFKDILKSVNDNYKKSQNYSELITTYSISLKSFFISLFEDYIQKNQLSIKDYSPEQDLSIVWIGSHALKRGLPTSDIEFLIMTKSHMTLDLLKCISGFMSLLKEVGMTLDKENLYPPILDTENNATHGSPFLINSVKNYSNILEIPLYTDRRVSKDPVEFKNRFLKDLSDPTNEIKKLYSKAFILPFSEGPYINKGSFQFLSTVLFSLRGISEDAFVYGNKALFNSFLDLKQKKLETLTKEITNYSIKEFPKSYQGYLLNTVNFLYKKYSATCGLTEKETKNQKLQLTLETLNSKKHLYRLWQLVKFNLPLWTEVNKETFGRQDFQKILGELLSQIDHVSSYLRMRELFDKKHKGIDQDMFIKLLKDLQLVHDLLWDNKSLCQGDHTFTTILGKAKKK